MKHYLNKFANPAAYTTAKAGSSFYKPAVSLIDSTHDVMYDPVFFFNPRYLYSDLSTSKNLNSAKTVIGIEVIPGSHMSDGKTRYVSVKNMSRSNPEAGSVETGNESTNSAAMIPWGNYNDDVDGLTNYSTGAYGLATGGDVTEANPYGLVNSVGSVTNPVFLTSDYDNGVDNNQYPFFEGAYIQPPLTSSGVTKGFIPYPFNADGTKNTLYSSNGEGMAITDMDGAGNTDTLIERMDIEGWQTGELNTTVGDGSDISTVNHPAAVACYRFNPASSNTAHQWYLPSIGELGYLFANIAKINAKIDALPSGQGVKLGMLNSQTLSVGSLGGWLWSSSEYNVNNAWGLYLGNGSLDNGHYSSKDTANEDGRVRAFFSLQ
jgi:hypothetical protein